MGSELEAILKKGEARDRAFNRVAATSSWDHCIEQIKHAQGELSRLRAALRVAVSEIMDAGSLCDSHAEPDEFAARILAALKGQA